MPSDDEESSGSPENHKPPREVSKGESEDEASVLPQTKTRATTIDTDSDSDSEMRQQSPLHKLDKVEVVVGSVGLDRSKYKKVAQSDTVEKILKSVRLAGGEYRYQVQFEDDREEEVSE
jgi:hypothetical protein